MLLGACVCGCVGVCYWVCGGVCRSVVLSVLVLLYVGTYRILRCDYVTSCHNNKWKRKENISHTENVKTKKKEGKKLPMLKTT